MGGMEIRMERLQRDHIKNNNVIQKLKIVTHNKTDPKIWTENFTERNLGAKIQIEAATKKERQSAKG